MVAVVLLAPLSLVLRYRAGTARRRARGWVATINVFAIWLSVLLFLLASGVTSIWVPHAFTYALLGLAGGAVLGWLGLAASRWEHTDDALHYTPNRWLVLAITLLITSRMAYGIWRGWHAWHSRPDDVSCLAASGAAGSLAVGAVVLGYYLIYWTGLSRRVGRHRRQQG